MSGIRDLLASLDKRSSDDLQDVEDYLVSLGQAAMPEILESIAVINYRLQRSVDPFTDMTALERRIKLLGRMKNLQSLRAIFDALADSAIAIVQYKQQLNCAYAINDAFVRHAALLSSRAHVACAKSLNTSAIDALVAHGQAAVPYINALLDDVASPSQKSLKRALKRLRKRKRWWQILGAQADDLISLKIAHESELPGLPAAMTLEMIVSEIFKRYDRSEVSHTAAVIVKTRLFDLFGEEAFLKVEESIDMLEAQFTTADSSSRPNLVRAMHLRIEILRLLGGNDERTVKALISSLVFFAVPNSRDEVSDALHSAYDQLVQESRICKNWLIEIGEMSVNTTITTIQVNLLANNKENSFIIALLDVLSKIGGEKAFAFLQRIANEPSVSEAIRAAASVGLTGQDSSYGVS